MIQMKIFNKDLFTSAILFLVCTFPYGRNATAQNTDSATARQSEFEATRTIKVIGIDLLKLPKPNEITKMTAELYSGPIGAVPIDPFVVPRSDHKTILKWFNGVTIDPNPVLGWEELGMLKIYTKSPDFIRIIWYWAGKNPLNCSIYGMRCQCQLQFIKETSRDESIVFGHEIRKIYEKSK